MIPADAAGLVMNVAAIAPTAPSFLTVFPSDVTRPLAANLNWLANDPPLSNAVTTDISADGRISFYNLSGSVHISADIVGYFVDHNHDDRYYPRAEVDAALALKVNAAELQAAIAATPTAWGMARADGSLRAQSTNVVQVLHPGVGLYCVVFDPPVSGGRLESATISGSGSGPIMGEKTNGIGGADSCTGAPGGNGLELRIYDETGALSDERFGFIVP